MLFLLRKKHCFSPILYVGLSLHILLWNVYPIVYLSLSNYDLAFSFITRSEYTELAFVQLATDFIILFAFLLIKKPLFPSIAKMGSNNPNITPKASFVILITWGTLSLILTNWQQSQLGSDYLTRNAYLISNNASDMSGLTSSTMITGLFLSFVIASLFCSWKDGFEKKCIAIVGWTYLLFSSLSAALNGGRIAILLPAVVMLMISIANPSAWLGRHKLFIGLMFSFMLAFAPLFSIAISSLRQVSSLNIQSILRETKDMSDNISIEKKIELIARDLYIKLDTISYGRVLLNSTGNTPVGMLPLLSSMLSPIPRFLYPQKPVPTSCNGEYSGTPAYIAGQALSDSLSMNVGANSVAISLWELGLLGVALQIVACIFFLLLSNSLLISNSVVNKTIGIYMIQLPLCPSLLSPASSIVRDSIRALLFIMLFRVIIFLLTPSIRHGSRLSSCSLDQWEGSQSIRSRIDITCNT